MIRFLSRMEPPWPLCSLHSPLTSSHNNEQNNISAASGQRSAVASHLQAKGLSCHLHANGVIGGDGNGAGGHAVVPVEELFEGKWHSAEHTSSECGNPSAGPHLVHQVHCPFTRCFIRRAGCTPPPPLPTPLLWHMGTARAFQTQIS